MRFILLANLAYRQCLEHSFGNDLELRKKLSESILFGQPRHLPHPTLPPVQRPSGSRWLYSPQKVWLWMRQCIEVTGMGKFCSVIPSGNRRSLGHTLTCCRDARTAICFYTTPSSSFQTSLDSKRIKFTLGIFTSFTGHHADWWCLLRSF